MSLSASSFALVGHELGRILPFSRHGQGEEQGTKRLEQDLRSSEDRPGDDLDASSSGLTWADTLDLSQLGP